MSIMPTGAEPVSDRRLAENPAVVITIGDRLGTPDALDWATAESVIRGHDLRIVQALGGPQFFNPYWQPPAADPESVRRADSIMSGAVLRAQQVAPGSMVRASVAMSSSTSALMRSAARGALVVAASDRSPSSQRALTRLLRARGSIALVRLNGHATTGWASGRVVAVIDDGCGAGLEAVLATAFHEAALRGAALTVLLAARGVGGAVAATIERMKRGGTSVEVSIELALSADTSDVAQQTGGAALLVLAKARWHERSRGVWIRDLIGRTTSPVLLESAQQPIRRRGLRGRRRSSAEPVSTPRHQG